jgi:hypothetical protein
MHVSKDGMPSLVKHIRDEVEFRGDVAKGAKGPDAKRVQEWLNLHGRGVAVDGGFGVVTEAAVMAFQGAKRLEKTGRVDAATYEALVAPMLRVLNPDIAGEGDFGKLVVALAKVHLREHPREVGGDNCGPWVRLYMDGREGKPWFWCAGFVTFVMKQAADILGVKTPIKGSVSCDDLAAQGKAANRFLAAGAGTPAKVTPGALFLVRSKPGDWTHTGIVTKAEAELFQTIEGNTNDDGSRNGFEVCARRRGYDAKDFVLL